MTAKLAFGIQNGRGITYAFGHEIEGFRIPPLLCLGMVLRFDHGTRAASGEWEPADGGSPLRATVEGIEGIADETLSGVDSCVVRLLALDEASKEDLDSLIGYHRHLKEKK